MNWRKIFFENYKAKIALFLMAVFLWFFVVSSREYVQVLNVPVRGVNLPANRVLLVDLPRMAQVRFQGKGTSLLLLSLFGEPHLDVDLSTPGYSYLLHPGLDEVDWSPAIEVQALDIVSPDTLYVQMDDVIKKRLKVRPLLTVKPADGYAIVAPLKVVPDSVTATGARSILQRMDDAPTQSRILDDVTDALKLNLGVVAPAHSGVTYDPPSVNVMVDVERAVEKQAGASLDSAQVNQSR